jgi:hypothetical protein
MVVVGLLLLGSACSDDAADENAALAKAKTVEEIAAALRDSGVPCGDLDFYWPNQDPTPARAVHCGTEKEPIDIATFKDAKSREAWVEESHVFGFVTFESDDWVVTAKYPSDVVKELDDAVGGVAELTCSADDCLEESTPKN